MVVRVFANRSIDRWKVFAENESVFISAEEARERERERERERNGSELRAKWWGVISPRENENTCALNPYFSTQTKS